MKKVLFTATEDSFMFAFQIPYLQYFKNEGYEVHVATNGSEKIPYCDKKITVPFERNPFKIKNLRALKQLKKLIDTEKYDLIHTHTPVGSVITRIAAKKARKNHHTRVIYTAHGFHFYKGAPLKNWLMYYTVEKKLAKYTDDLITINKEDYEIAKKKFKTNVHYIPGVGIDPKKFDIKMSEKDKEKFRKSLGLKKEDFVIIFPAELNQNKNQIVLIEAMKKLVKKHPKIHLLLPGRDSYNGQYQAIVAKENLDNNIHFLGFRKDIPKLLKISNISVSSSLREGLPVNIIEAMYSGLPIISMKCRGMEDLITDKENGFIINQNDVDGFVNAIEKIYTKKINTAKFKKYNENKTKIYLLDNILKHYIDIYKQPKRIIYLRSTSVINESRAIKEIETYIENNYKITILGWDRQGIIGPNEELKKKVNLKTFNLKSTYGSGMKNIIRYARFQLWLYSNLRKERKNYDIIHACDYDTAYIGYKIAKKYNKKMIYDIYDYYVDCHKLSFLKNIIEKKDIKIINNADCVILCTEQRKKQISKAKPKKVIIVNNTPDIKIKPQGNKKSIKKIKICFVGMLQDDRLLVEVSEQLKDNSKYELHIGGFGKYEDYFKQISKESKNIFYHGQMKYDDVLKLENECDILFATYNPQVANHKYSAPNKLYEAMALGKPIIVCNNTGIDEIVVKEKIGYSINYNAKEFEEALNKISIDNYNKMAEIGKKLYNEKYTWEKMKEELINEIEGRDTN